MKSAPLNFTAVRQNNLRAGCNPMHPFDVQGNLGGPSRILIRREFDSVGMPMS
ncbi:MAG TPA: hypothetical protein VJQ54_20655 [Candidatus Sulfotelmatobacter sp.]|nr:hypothetical protein [Candidatus Sulfotelmatobacter sp.]